jgi:S-adenosylmethionine:tRNA ribosyltransferase-isomerase
VSTRLNDYNYELPRELIAQHPLPQSRRFAHDGGASRPEENRTCRFVDLKKFLRDDDLLVLNNSRVLPARHFSDDGNFEFLFLEKTAPCRWKALVKPSRKFGKGAAAVIQGVRAEAGEIFEDGSREITLSEDVDVQQGGAMPLPPYIKRSAVIDPRYRAEDEARYQTVFAKYEGSLAAPTAGLHFTPQILGILPHVFITLHVGTATFRPVKVEDITQHQMHPERFSISPDAAEAIANAKRVVAVGTTTVRVLGIGSAQFRENSSRRRRDEYFIYPPFQFRVVDVLLTNFHLPRSTFAHAGKRVFRSRIYPARLQGSGARAVSFL